MKLCYAEWCEWIWNRKWYCYTHYYEIIKDWDPLKIFSKEKCKVLWCFWPRKAMYYCGKHYTKRKRYWDPLKCLVATNWDRNKSSLYKTYNGMKDRCYNANQDSYKYYWWRWIKICDRWLWIDWFDNFISDMWPKPDTIYKYSVDRINNDWDYCPENCRRADWITQANNRRNRSKKYK